MASSIATGKPENMRNAFAHGAGNGAGGWTNGGGGGGSGRFVPLETYRMGMWFAVAGIAMLFIALTSAYAVRQGLGPDWQAIPMPRILWLTTALLLTSSITMEKARRAVQLEYLGRWLAATLLLGVAFLGGQFFAWLRLEAQGLYLATNPHSSFFYVLTGLHGIHIAGGIAALSYLLLMLRREYVLQGGQCGPVPTHGVRWVEVVGIYWHFMDGLWLYLLVMLFAWT